VSHHEPIKVFSAVKRIARKKSHPSSIDESGGGFSSSASRGASDTLKHPSSVEAKTASKGSFFSATVGAGWNDFRFYRLHLFSDDFPKV
jgi:hypothetical protein